MKNIQDFPFFIDMHYKKTFKVITFIAANMFQVVSNLGDITYVVKLLKELTNWNESFIKLDLFIVYMAILILVMEPEKMKNYNTIITILFCSMGRFATILTLLLITYFSDDFFHRCVKHSLKLVNNNQNINTC